MRRLCLFLLFAGCGLSPRTYCEEVARVTCRKVYACATTPEERDALALQFADEKACTTTLQERSKCTTQDEKSVCGARRWVPGNATTCVKEIESLTCEQASTFRPTCESPCAE